MNVVARKSWSVRDNLAGLLAEHEDGREVVLEISLTGIKVTEQQQVMMTHPLKRISYATCDPIRGSVLASLIVLSEYTNFSLYYI